MLYKPTNLSLPSVLLGDYKSDKSIGLLATAAVHVPSQHSYLHFVQVYAHSFLKMQSVATATIYGEFEPHVVA